jgi:hypothetical protein
LKTELFDIKALGRYLQKYYFGEGLFSQIDIYFQGLLYSTIRRKYAELLIKKLDVGLQERKIKGWALQIMYCNG